MLKIVKANKIKLRIEKETLQYLRDARIVTRFIAEIRKCNFDFENKPKLTIKSINWENSIYGADFWQMHYNNCQFYKHHVIKRKRINNFKIN